jgi:hypothetical protein
LRVKQSLRRSIEFDAIPQRKIEDSAISQSPKALPAEASMSVGLSAAVRTNLIVLHQLAGEIGRVQTRLATGKRINRLSEVRPPISPRRRSTRAPPRSTLCSTASAPARKCSRPPMPPSRVSSH